MFVEEEQGFSYRASKSELLFSSILCASSLVLWGFYVGLHYEVYATRAAPTLFGLLTIIIRARGCRRD